MKFSLFILFYLLSVFSLVNCTSIPSIVVEGFYWKIQKQYTHQQRRFLIQILPKESIYIHMPQIIHTLNPWTSAELSEWQATKKYCISRGVQLIIGIRTMFIEDVGTALKKIEAKIKQLDVPFILGWDDCPGGETEAQKRLQLQIIEKLSVKPWAIVPAAYYSQDGSVQKWMDRLSILNDADDSIPFILCSKDGINPSAFEPTTDFPPLNRKMIFWDNWMAVDSLERFPRNLPRKRSPKLFNDNYPYGYMLNLCFPPERIIHGVNSIEYLKSRQEYDYNGISNVWTRYLLNHGFIVKEDATLMQNVLYEVMFFYNETMSVQKMIEKYPVLDSFLYT